jgi:hypothetical protein
MAGNIGCGSAKTEAIKRKDKDKGVIAYEKCDNVFSFFLTTRNQVQKFGNSVEYH